MTASEGNDVRKHRMERWMQQAYVQTYFEQFYQIVELSCASGNNGHALQICIYV